MRHATIDMTQGGITINLLRFALPLMLSSMLQQLYNTVDSIIVGRYVGLEALAAVGMCGTVINLLISFLTGVTSGMTVVVAKYRGARNGAMTWTTVLASLGMTLLLALVISAAGFWGCGALLRWIDTPAELMDSARRYLRISFGLCAFMTLYNTGSALLRGLGNARAPLLILLATCVVNVLLDVLFVAVWGWGTDGAAWATMIAQGISAVLMLRPLLRAVQPPADPCLHRAEGLRAAREILLIGLPSGVQQLLSSLCGVVVQGLINSFGTLYIAANNIVVKVDHFCVQPIMSFSAALNTFISQNAGAGDMRRVRRGARAGLIAGSVLALASSVLMLLFGRYPMYLFTDDQAAIDTAFRILCIIVPFWVFFAAQHNVSAILRGLGDGLIPMVVSMCSLILLRIPLAYLLYAWTGDEMTNWWSMAAIWAVTGGILLFYYLSGRWKQNPRIRRFIGKDV